MDVIQLYQDYGIDYRTEGHKHCRPGWANLECPFCTGNPGLHLGYNMEQDYYFCWRCGWHSTIEVVSTLLHIKEKEARSIIKQYGGESVVTKPKVKILVSTLSLPSNVEPLQEKHRRYLEKRNFDPDKLIADWGILGTGPFSRFKELDYRFRIVIPITWNQTLVSFESRDITGKSLWKYLACPDGSEVIPRKHILYGNQSKWGDSIICVEGATDVWRLGCNAVATFGTKYTNYQIRELAKFKRVAVMYDGPSETSAETEALNQAKNLISELKFRGVDAFHVPIIGDPGSMKQEDADYLVKQIIK